MGNLICASCRACPELKGSVTSASFECDVRHDANSAPAAAAASHQHTTTTTSAITNTETYIRRTDDNELSKQSSLITTNRTNNTTTTLANSSSHHHQHSATDNGTSAAAATVGDAATSSWHLYLTDEVHCLHNDKPEDEQLSDIEKVAKGIVDVNLFITSQVIIPALASYRQEMLGQQQQLGDVTEADLNKDDEDDSDDTDDNYTQTDKLPAVEDTELTIRVNNEAGIHLIDTVTMY